MNNNIPLFSVIMPVYNRETLLPHSLESVLSQKFENFELVCIDDGSTDNSLNVLWKYQMNDSRIKIFHQENKGRCIARNVGIKHSIATWVCFLDSDDIYYDNHLSVLKDSIDKYPEVNGFATSQVCLGKFKKDGVSKAKSPLTKLGLQDFITNNPIQLNQFCYNKKNNPNLFFPDINILYSEDLLFMRKFCLNNFIYKINIVTNEVVEHANRSMYNYNPHDFVKWNLFSANYFINKFPVPEIIKHKILSHTILLCANVLLSNKEKKRGVVLVLNSLKHIHSYFSPLFYRSLIKMLM